MNLNGFEDKINGRVNLESNNEEYKITSHLKREMSFRQAIENSIPSGIAVIDNSGKQVYVNQSFCKMVGWDEIELLGKLPPFAYWPLKEIETLNNAFQQTLDNNAPKEGFDLVFLHKTGKLIPVNVIISPFEQEDDKMFFLANVIDLTQRKKDEKALKESHLLLTSSIESQKNTIIFSIDQHYNYLYYNKAHRDAMKFAYNSIADIGKNFLSCISKDEDRRLLKENIDYALKGESKSFIQRFGDVNLDYYEVSINPILNDENKIFGCTFLARNISERIQAENALKESETKFKEVIDQVNDAIIVFDRQRKIVIWNKGAEQLCGLNAGDVLNKSIIDIQLQLTPPPNNSRERIEKVINSIITQETSEVFDQIIESEIIPLNSKRRLNIQSRVFPINLNGDYLFCAVTRDITEIKRYEKELLRVSAEKDKFYSTIAQYLYTPFNIFNNFAKSMSEELDNLPIKEIQKMVLMMSKSATNLYNLLDNLLQWTRIHQGKIPFEPQKLNFKKISLEAFSILKSNAEVKNIKINLLVKDGIFVFADIFMLKTILRNLVTNAIIFANNDGQIDIYVKEAPSNIIISVRYNGITITQDYLTKLFDYSPVHSAFGAPEEKGTTLGLLLCNEFVEKHGGKIWVEGENGKGCEFRFTLPTSAE